ncbi:MULTISPECIES: hydrogenase maturation protease [unclassified Methanoregula]|uniref:hydrogenase maturation protease n=1 Tax=unclassified Methanoregula TaxID=2649730 RepID=UPI0009C4CE7E|nr:MULTISPECIES: hydrogenase maturation protease [unclassified Methanoregula]OPX64258.1 MAG: hydrogenase 3 maturation protease [Methanoregula sp. PtaB.Bin085]OPY33617.1 MAG: hydrogenase 3 maturation protease [Methanoregula sp. PtaU1.Bin006]
MENTSLLTETLPPRIRGAGRLAVVGIGDELSPPDSLGMTAAREIEKHRIPGVTVFFAGTVPESITGPLRRFRPDHILFLDAADSGARPGTIAVIEPEQIQATLITTHALPLGVVMEYVGRETRAGVSLLGIQPDVTKPDRDLSCPDLMYLEQNLEVLVRVLRER